MEIVDAQIHRPRAALARESELGADAADALALEIEIAAMDAAGVDAAVVVGGGSGDRTAPLRFCAFAARRQPDRFVGVVPVVDLDAQDHDGFIAGLRSRGIVGIRVAAVSPTRAHVQAHFDDGRYEPWFAAAERQGVPVCLYCAGVPHKAARVARDHPGLTVIVDHIGMRHPPYDSAGPDLFDPLPDLLALARFPNVAVKFSGVPALSTEGYPFADVWPNARRIIEAFGPARLMWGSDYTRCAGMHTYSESVNFLRYSDEVSAADKELMFGGTLRRLFRWEKGVTSGVAPSP